MEPGWGWRWRSRGRFFVAGKFRRGRLRAAGGGGGGDPLPVRGPACPAVPLGGLLSRSSPCHRPRQCHPWARPSGPAAGTGSGARVPRPEGFLGSFPPRVRSRRGGGRCWAGMGCGRGGAGGGPAPGGATPDKSPGEPRSGIGAGAAERGREGSLEPGDGPARPGPFM